MRTTEGGTAGACGPHAVTHSPRRSKDRSARSCAGQKQRQTKATLSQRSRRTIAHAAMLTRWDAPPLRRSVACTAKCVHSHKRLRLRRHVLRWACAPARAVPHQSKSRSAVPFVIPHVCPNLFQDALCACVATRARVVEGVCEGVQMASCERGLPRHECTRVHSSFGCGPLRRSPALLAAMRPRHAPRESQRMRYASRLRRKHGAAHHCMAMATSDHAAA